MKLSTIAFLFLMGSLLIVVQGFRPYIESPGPQSPGDGYVMGLDFTTLLANPNVTLKIEQTGDTVYFAWSSSSTARLDEVRRMGEYMQSVKRDLETHFDKLEGVDAGVKTAASY